MRPYETAFLIAPNLPEEETEKLIEKMAGIVTKKKGKKINIDKWGKKRLAYPINKFEEAFYVFLQYEGEASIPLELERNFKQTEAVIRFLTIKLEERENIRIKKKGKPKAPRMEEHRETPPEEEAGEAPALDEVRTEEKIEEQAPETPEPKEEEPVIPKEEKTEEETPAEEKEETLLEKEEKPEEKEKEK